MKDDQKDDDTDLEIDQGIEVVFTCSQKGKEPQQPDKNKSKDWKVIKIKSKDQAEAERLFFQYCSPTSSFWSESRKQAALNMLGSGIFGDNLLKGHAKRQETYPVNLGALIINLVNLHSEYAYEPSISELYKDVVDTFDHHFSYVSEIAQIAGVEKKVINDCWDAWRKKISKAVNNGKISRHWRRLIEEKVFRGQYGAQRVVKIAYQFADFFLSYVLLAPPNRIADWVNAILESLGWPSLCKSSLRAFVKAEQNRIAQPPEPTAE